MNDLLLRRRMMMGSHEAPVPVFHKYLVYAGTNWINTGVTLPQGASIYIEDIGYETVKGYQGYFRGHAGQSYTNVKMGCRANNNTTSTNRVLSVRYNGSSSKTTKNVAWTTEHFDLWQTPTKLGVDDSYNSYSRSTDVDLGVLAMGEDYAGSASARLFTGKHSTVYVYGSDAASANLYTDRASYTPVAILTPCTYKGKAGLWVTTPDNPDGHFVSSTGGAGLDVGD